MPLGFFYTMVQKSEKWPKTQIKGVLPLGITRGLEIGLSTKITFGLFLKINLKRIYGWKLCEKNQLRSLYKMPSMLLSCIGFLYKGVHTKLGNCFFLCVRFHNFLFLLTFEQLKPRSWKLAKFFSIAFSPTCCWWFLISVFVQELLTVFTPPPPQKKWAKFDMRACLFLYFWSKFKKSRARFISSQIPLAKETKRKSLGN